MGREGDFEYNMGVSDLPEIDREPAQVNMTPDQIWAAAKRKVEVGGGEVAPAQFDQFTPGQTEMANEKAETLHLAEMTEAQKDEEIAKQIAAIRAKMRENKK